MDDIPETISVAEYCKRHNVSSQSVYAKIKRGTLEHTVVNGIKMVVDDSPFSTGSEEVTNDNAVINLLQSIINDLKKENKRLKKRITKLENQHMKDTSVFRDLLYGTIALPEPVSKREKRDEFVDAEIVKKKRKKKKGKK